MAIPHAAVVGLGFMGYTHTQALHRLGIPVDGVLGATYEEGRVFAQAHQIPKVYSSFEELAADKAVNVVHLCTPNYLHFSMSKEAMEAGKHVICEKPLATTSQETGELAQLAKKKGLFGVVNYNLRFYPLCQEARARIHAGELGDIRLVQGGYLQDWLFYPTDWNWRLEPEEGGELRVVADIGTHFLDMITFLTGLEVAELLADMATFIPTRYRPRKAVATFDGKLARAEDGEPVNIRTEDCATLLLRFSNGARGSVLLSQISPGRKNYFWWELDGSKSSVRWDQENPNRLWFGYRDKPNEILEKDPALMHAEARPMAGYPGGHAEGYPDTFFQVFKSVYGAIEAGKPLPGIIPTFADGDRELKLCEAIQRSAKEGAWVKV